MNRFTERLRRRQVGKLTAVIDKLYKANAATLCERVCTGFLEHVRIASQPHADLKQLKRRISKGPIIAVARDSNTSSARSLRYRSIRELVTGDSGLVIKDLKPVWLMSPLSASDALPLETNHFDVVIFDEASQVTLEGAVPSLFRAAQAIVVGDQMQLPPTSFFSTKQLEDQDNLVIEEDVGGETVEHDLEKNSFLAYAARVLPATMLGWHYRSRSESLISYSNAAFYQGRLLTVPDKTLPSPQWSEIKVTDSEQGATNLPHLLERPVSYHFMVNGVYRDRRNLKQSTLPTSCAGWLEKRA